MIYRRGNFLLSFSGLYINLTSITSSLNIPDFNLPGAQGDLGDLGLVADELESSADQAQIIIDSWSGIQT